MIARDVAIEHGRAFAALEVADSRHRQARNSVRQASEILRRAVRVAEEAEAALHAAHQRLARVEALRSEVTADVGPVARAPEPARARPTSPNTARRQSDEVGSVPTG